MTWLRFISARFLIMSSVSFPSLDVLISNLEALWQTSAASSASWRFLLKFMFFSLANLSTSGFLALASCLGDRLLGMAPRLGPTLTSVLLTSGSLGVRETLESDSKLSYPESDSWCSSDSSLLLKSTISTSCGFGGRSPLENTGVLEDLKRPGVGRLGSREAKGRGVELQREGA